MRAVLEEFLGVRLWWISQWRIGYGRCLGALWLHFGLGE